MKTRSAVLSSLRSALRISVCRPGFLEIPADVRNPLPFAGLSLQGKSASRRAAPESPLRSCRRRLLQQPQHHQGSQRPEMI